MRHDANNSEQKKPQSKQITFISGRDPGDECDNNKQHPREHGDECTNTHTLRSKL